MRLLGRITRKTASLLAGLAVLAVCGYGLLLALGYRPVVVLSGSMRPKLGVGSLAVVRPVPADRLRVGDVITFQDPYRRDRLITHRVHRILVRNGQRVYRTKGDANPAPDPWAIKLPGTVGRFSFDVPLVGYALVYSRTREIRSLLLLTGSALVLLGLLRRIWRSDSPLEAPA